ncbi:MAG: hypothetical protein SNJ77_00275 [Cytophagales bacterium]
MQLRNKLLITSALIALFACESKKGSGESAFDSLMVQKAEEQESQLTSELALGVIRSIPSPIEMSVLIKEVGAKYSPSILNSTSNSQNYNTNAKRAMNMGIYGADLGYINIYNQKQDAITYLNSITGLAEDLKIGHFFDITTLKRMATNSSNLDSLLYISTSNFEYLNNYLQDQNRGNLSTFMLLGGWIEALHVATEVAKNNKSQKLIEKIGEQKVVLDQLMLLFDIYKSDPSAAEISPFLKDLKASYDKVLITQEYREPTITEVNGIMMVTDNSVTKINITPDLILEISNKVKNVRNKIVS